MAHPADTAVRSWDTMYTLTWQARRKNIVDQVMQATPVFYKLSSGKRVRTETGSLYIEQPVSFGLNDTVKSVGRGESVALSDLNVRTVSKWDWKYVHGQIVSYFVDRQRNAGEYAVKNRVNADIDLLRDSTIQQFEKYMFGDGTGNSGKDPDGLGNIVAVAPTTGVVGGINRATFSWWRNQMATMSGKSMASYLQTYMLNMYNTCGLIVNGERRFPDLIVTTQTVHESWESQLVELLRIPISDKKLADMGFGELMYKGAPMIWSPQCPTGYMYFLNTTTLSLVKDTIAFMKLGKWMDLPEQAAEDRVAHMMSVCNLTCDCPAKNGVIHTITTE